MEVILAKKAGFCFGVKRAVDMAYAEAEKNIETPDADRIPVYTYGPIIHNEEVTGDLERKGVRCVNDLDELVNMPPSVVIIRSHGIGRKEYEQLKEAGHRIVDATCPFVGNIHRIVRESSEKGDVIIIVGDPGHAEVEGIRDWCAVKPFIIQTEEEISSLPDFEGKQITVVSQTTFHLKKFEKIVVLLKEKYYNNIRVCQTICNATEERQTETREIASRVDAMIVIGGKHSSNTQKLADISRQACENTYYIQTLDDLDLTAFESVRRVGITAGASTPSNIIKEVHDSMSEENFEQMLQEETPVSIHPGQIVEGRVIEVKPDEIVVNINYKSDGIVTASEYSNSPVDLTEVVKVDDAITAKVLKVNDGDGQVLLSVKKVKAEKAYDALEESFNNGSTVKGVVTQAMSGGLSVSVDECRVFIPASLVSDTYEKNLEKYVGQEVEFIITEFNPHKRRVIGNRKQLVAAQKKAAAEALFSRIEVGQTVEGTVKNVTDFGAFIDLGGADGLLHISEMSWGRVENPKKIFKVGDMVKCFIKSIDGEKIALSLKFDDQNPWLSAAEKYAIGTVVTGRVARMTDFGAFIVLEPGIDALLHVSQISSEHVEKPSDVLKTGETITAKVVDFKGPEKKISLSIKALLKDVEADEEPAVEEEAESVASAGEEESETIAVPEEVAEAVEEAADAE
ncbi:MAG: bifunctional 4-hydroxy-3-methylbut-2-enyl diphosphate reductase/30S ribosomal protein S1 [Eubacterium sp.]|nr:bifunctional 4-hydroxy-3-methylbut-2-enyl diphosphate reductase/30S ribosomal protein S1 [Eubacterium sp.]